MQLKALLEDDDAVSPVIGVILMVAITVILAAVIATFVLGLGDQVSNTSPQASFSTDYKGSSGSPDDLDITHSGGDSIQADNLYLRGDAGEGGAASPEPLDQTWDAYSSQDPSSDVKAGMTATVGNIGSDGEVDIIWEPSSGDSSATLGGWTGPDN
jgi:flagellin-like protein